MSQNEWKTTEIRAWQSWEFLTLFLPRLGPLSECESLKSLDIRDTFVTGSIARLFYPLHNLEILDLKGTAVEDVGEFKRAHPNCRITGFSLSRRRYRATGESTAW